MDDVETLSTKLITGCHILHHQGVLDAFGHLSFRHPDDPSLFIMSRNMAPGTVSRSSDLVQYRISDAEPVESNAPRGFLERYIHSEIYKCYPGVNSVVHSHSEAVVPYSINGVPLRACYHMAGFLGEGAPVWDIAQCYGPNDGKDMLVRSVALGKGFATSFDDRNVPGSASSAESDFPEHRVALMRGHGFTAVAESIERCVMTAVYAQKNAVIQTTALLTRVASVGAAGTGGRGMGWLSKEEAVSAADTNFGAAQRPWDLWCKEVEAHGFYSNS